ncbi:MAG: DUF3400 domain-containing protein [Proteobacteria bacterium]|nr:DUF3400 domain-containing protein [Pseudomonadota bacterium]
MVELARAIRGPAWLTDYLERVKNGGIERVLL